MINSKRENSISKYIGELYTLSEGLLTIVPIRLKYIEPFSTDNTAYGVGEDVKELLKYTSLDPTMYKDKVGYVYKKHISTKLGIHVDIIIIYKGSVNPYMSRTIGDRWIKVTNGKGMYDSNSKILDISKPNDMHTLQCSTIPMLVSSKYDIDMFYSKRCLYRGIITNYMRYLMDDTMVSDYKLSRVNSYLKQYAIKAKHILEFCSVEAVFKVYNIEDHYMHYYGDNVWYTNKYYRHGRPNTLTELKSYMVDSNYRDLHSTDYNRRITLMICSNRTVDDLINKIKEIGVCIE